MPPRGPSHGRRGRGGSGHQRSTPAVGDSLVPIPICHNSHIADISTVAYSATKQMGVYIWDIFVQMGMWMDIASPQPFIQDPLQAAKHCDHERLKLDAAVADEVAMGFGEIIDKVGSSDVAESARSAIRFGAVASFDPVRRQCFILKRYWLAGRRQWAANGKLACAADATSFQQETLAGVLGVMATVDSNFVYLS